MVAHTWAHDAATPVDLVVVNDRHDRRSLRQGGMGGEGGERLASAPGRLVASPGGLVAMKATTVPLRASARPEKRASDLYDLARLLVADVGRPRGARRDAAVAPRRDRRRTCGGWFVDPAGRDRTYRDLRRFDDPPVDLDEVADAVEDLAP